MDILVPCEACGKLGRPNLVEVRVFKEHNESFHKGLEHQCPVCPNLFFSKQEAEMHHKEAHPKIQCLECLKKSQDVFFLSEDMKKHYFNEHKNCKLECTSCHNCFHLERDLQEHIEKVHYKTLKRPAKVQCLNCPKSFLSPSALEKHNQATHSDKTSKCPACFNRFDFDNDKDNHYTTCKWRYKKSSR